MYSYVANITCLYPAKLVYNVDRRRNINSMTAMHAMDQEKFAFRSLDKVTSGRETELSSCFRNTKNGEYFEPL